MRQPKVRPAMLLSPAPGVPLTPLMIPEDLDAMTYAIEAKQVTWERVQAGNVTFWVDEDGRAKGQRPSCIVHHKGGDVHLVGPVIVFVRGAKDHAHVERDLARWATW